MITACAISLFGCAPTYHRGDGIIIAEKKILDKDYKPRQATKNGILIGGSVGGVAGVLSGGFLGLLVSALTYSSTPITILSTASGGVIGGLVVGAACGALVGGLGYAADIATPGAGLYQFTVQSVNEGKPLIITQYATPIPLHTPVYILEKNNSIFIKKK